METYKSGFLGEMYDCLKIRTGAATLFLYLLNAGCSHIGGIGSGIKDFYPESETPKISYQTLLTPEINPMLHGLQGRLISKAYPDSFENIAKGLSGNFPNLNIDALDGQVNESDPTKLDIMVANATTELPKGVKFLHGQEGYDLASLVSKLSKKEVLDVAKYRNIENSYNGGAVVFLPEQNGEHKYVIESRSSETIFNLIHAATKKELESLVKGKEHKSVRIYNLKQGSNNIATLELYDMAEDKGVVIPSVYLGNTEYSLIPAFIPKKALKDIRSPSYKLVDKDNLTKIMGLLSTGALLGVNLGLGGFSALANLYIVNDFGKVITYQNQSNGVSGSLSSSSHAFSKEDIASILNSPSDIPNIVHSVLDDDKNLVGLAVYKELAPNKEEGDVYLHGEGLLVKQDKKIMSAFAKFLIANGFLAALYGWGHSEGRDSIHAGRVFKKIGRGGGHTRGGGEDLGRRIIVR